METLKPGRLINDSEPQKVIAALREVWNLHQAMLAYGLRDLKVRYANTRLGWIWLLLPFVLLIMPVVLISLKYQISMHSTHITKMMTILGGHILCSSIVQQTASIWVNQKQFLNKINLPVLFMPASRLIVIIPEWAIYSFIGLIGGLFTEGVIFGFVYFMVIQIFMFFGLGLGLLICTVSYKFRDVLHALPLLLQFQLVVIALQIARFIVPGDLKYYLLAYPPFFFADAVISQLSAMDVVLGSSVVFSILYLSLVLYCKNAKNALERV